MLSSPFLNSIREFMMVRRYSRRTIDSYLYWIKYFIIFNKKKHPRDLGVREVEAFSPIWLCSATWPPQLYLLH